MRTVMRTIICVSALASIYFMITSFSNHKKDGCESPTLIEEAKAKLKKYTLIQDYPFYIRKKKKKDEIEYKKQVVTLNRGVKYKFYAVKNAEYEGIPIVSIYNNEKQEFLLGTTYNAHQKRFYSEIEFECKTTGNYCLSFCFQDGLEGCAIGVFSSLIKD